VPMTAHLGASHVPGSAEMRASVDGRLPAFNWHLGQRNECPARQILVTFGHAQRRTSCGADEQQSCHPPC